MKILTLILLAALAASASGCAPVISKGTIDGAMQEAGFSDLLRDPGAYEGRTLILGGAILSVENRKEDTVVEVLQTALARRLKPVDPDESGGRFLVRFEGFRDPALYAPGRLITVAGVIEGAWPGKIGEKSYYYPVLRPVEHHLWREGFSSPPRVTFGLGLFYSD